MDYFSMEPMRYWAPASSMSPDSKRQHLEQMIAAGNYIWSQKYDGNWARAVVTSSRTALQTRGISKKTGTYGEVQNKVFFWNDIVKAFNKGDTVILGEIYLPGGIDKDTGAILRCLDDKALARQKDKKLEWRIFDILVLDGVNMMNEPVINRIKYIPEVVKRIKNDIFANEGEGAVCYKKTSIYEPGKRGPHSWDTCKVKQEISADIDTFIIGIEEPTHSYTGKDISSWTFWENTRTNEKVYGEYFGEYQIGGPYIPITKNYYYNWPGAMYLGVYKNDGNIIKLCKVAGLTEELKTELRDNFEKNYFLK